MSPFYEVEPTNQPQPINMTDRNTSLEEVIRRTDEGTGEQISLASCTDCWTLSSDKIIHCGSGA